MPNKEIVKSKKNLLTKHDKIHIMAKKNKYLGVLLKEFDLKTT